MGVVSRVFVGVDEYQDINAPITPNTSDIQRCGEALAALNKILCDVQVGPEIGCLGEAKLAGSIAADLHLAKADADIILVLNFTLKQFLEQHLNVLEAVRARLGATPGFGRVRSSKFSLQCAFGGLELDILLAVTLPSGPLTYLNNTLHHWDRRLLSASSALATAAFLKEQPPLFHEAVRVIKYWAKLKNNRAWDHRLRNKPKSYLLVLLTLKAYQDHMASAEAAGATRAAALDDIIRLFLRETSSLSASTEITWTNFYSREVIEKVTSKPYFRAGLHPRGFEDHPLVLDPLNPTNNVALGTTNLDKLRELAAADLAAVVAKERQQEEEQRRREEQGRQRALQERRELKQQRRNQQRQEEEEREWEELVERTWREDQEIQRQEKLAERREFINNVFLVVMAIVWMLGCFTSKGL